MPQYTLTFTDEQDAAIAAIAREEGLDDVQAYLQKLAGELLVPRVIRFHDTLIARAKGEGEPLGEAEKTALMAHLGLSR